MFDYATDILERVQAGDQDAAREMVRGLMRGDREELKLGYSAENAALAVLKFYRAAETEEEILELRGYADGFAAGMVRGSHLHGLQPEDPDDPYTAGFRAGLEEDPEKTYPARDEG